MFFFRRLFCVIVSILTKRTALCMFAWYISRQCFNWWLDRHNSHAAHAYRHISKGKRVHAFLQQQQKPIKRKHNKIIIIIFWFFYFPFNHWLILQQHFTIYFQKFRFIIYESVYIISMISLKQTIIRSIEGWNMLRHWD